MPAPAERVGISSSDRAMLDLNNLEVLSNKVSVADLAMSQETAAAYQRGEISLSPPPGPPPRALPPNPDPLQHAAESAPPGLVVTPTIPAAPAAAQSSPLPAAQAPTGAPVRPGDPPRFQARIDSLYGRMRSAEERAADAETRLSALVERMEARFASSGAPQNYSAQAPLAPPVAALAPPQDPYQANFQPPAEAGPAAGSFVSRAELQYLLGQQAQALAAENALRHAHTVSRSEAEKRFPDVFNNPELRSAADQIWSADAALQRDPRGPEKAAAIARGLYYNPSDPFPASPQVPAEVRKANLAGVGSSVPEGQAGPTRDQRYADALAYARSTGRLEDMARVMEIRRASP